MTWVEAVRTKSAFRLRLAVGIFATALFGTMVVSIHLSTLDVSFGSLLYGSQSVWRGRTAAFRVAAYDPTAGVLLSELRAEVRLVDAHGVRATAEVAGDQIIDVVLPVAIDLGRDARLEVTLDTPDGDDELSAALEPVDAPGALAGTLLPWTASLAPHAEKPRGPVDLELYPEGGDVVAGLTNEMVGRAVRNHSAWSTSLRLSDLGLQTTSDATGLFRFSYLPRPDGQPLTFLVGPPPGELVRVGVEARPRQLLLRTVPPSFVPVGARIQLQLDTLPARGPIHVDLWCGRALLAMSRIEPGPLPRTGTLTLPEAAPGLYRVSAYRSPVAPESASASHLVSAGPDDRATHIEQAITSLRDLGGAQRPVDLALDAPTIESRAVWVSIAMSRFSPDSPGVPLLRSTVEQRRLAVRTRRDALRARTHVLFAGTVLVGIALAIAWVAQHQLRVRRAVRDVIDEGVREGEDLDTEELGKVGRLVNAYQLWLVPVSLALLLYGIYVLLRSLRWGW